MKILNQKGFTLVELMIATAIFTIILLIATTGIIRIGNIYYKGIITSQTQNATRSIGNNLSTSLQFASADIVVPPSYPPGYEYFCLGNTIYVYYLGVQYKKANNNPWGSGLYSEDLANGSGCAPTNTQCAGAIITNCYTDRRQLLGEGMRVLVLKVKPVGASSDLYSVSLRLIYGDNDLLTNYDNNGVLLASPPPNDQVTCKSGVAGSSFCGVALLDTVVKKRLNI